MKAFVFVALAVIAVCCAAEDFPVLYTDNVTHIVIPKGKNLAIYKWPKDVMGYGYGEGCYGTVKMYQKKTFDINPAYDDVYTTFNEQKFIHLVTIKNSADGYYVGFAVDEAKDDGPEGINGAIDFVFTTVKDGYKQYVPETFDQKVGMNINLNSNTATLTWTSSGTDNTIVYRKDKSLKSYDPSKDFPPVNYYQTGCSAKLWMEKDDVATGEVVIKRANDKYTGAVQLKGITKKDVAMVAITTEKKDVPYPFTASYDFVALGAASTKVISSVALFFLLISVLLI